MAQALSPDPLSLAGHGLLLEWATTGRAALILTGFRIPAAGMPQTDGLIGSALLAFAFVKAAAALSVFVCEPLHAIGLN